MRKLGRAVRLVEGGIRWRHSSSVRERDKANQSQWGGENELSVPALSKHVRASKQVQVQP